MGKAKAKPKEKENKALPWLIFGGAVLLLTSGAKAGEPTPDPVPGPTPEPVPPGSCPVVGLNAPVGDYPYYNPGAILRTSINWAGKVPGAACFHEKFESPYYGWRALFSNLKAYIQSGFDNVEEIIYRWAKGSTGTLPNSYIDFVVNHNNAAGEGQITRYTPIYLNSGNVLYRIGIAIARFENGTVNDDLWTAQYDDITRAFNDVF